MMAQGKKGTGATADCAACGHTFKLKPYRLKRSKRLCCSTTCEERLPSQSSRYAVKQRDGKQYYEHRIVAVAALGKPLPPKAVVHHHDGNKKRNVKGNLVICENNGYQHLLHKRQRILKAGGNPNKDSWCSSCQRPRPLDQFWFRKTRAGNAAPGTPTTVCKSCSKRQRVAAA